MPTYRVGLRQMTGQAQPQSQQIEADGFAVDRHGDREPVYNFKLGDLTVHSFPVTAVAYIVQQQSS